MNFSTLPFYDNKVLFGHNNLQNVVAVEVDEKASPYKAALYIRTFEGGVEKVEKREEEFLPFVLVQNLSLLNTFDGSWNYRELAGGNEYKFIVYVNDGANLKKILNHLKKVTGASYGAPSAPYFYMSDLVQQYLTISGITHFKGMSFERLHRMQIDIETYCSPDYEFPNPERAEDRIIIISMRDSKGWERLISGRNYDEKAMIEEMLKEINERDPDVLEGHNFHRFDLAYIETRAKMLGVKLKMGRNNEILTSHNSRMNIAERTIVYPKYSAAGRHIIDTWILAQLYDVSVRELESYGLKDIARHFDVSPPNRTYIEGSKIPETFIKDPERLEKYAMDDVRETDAISRILSPSYFIQAQTFPYSYQNITVRGNATRIDSLFIREYLRQGTSIPKPPAARQFAGAYTDVFTTGVLHDVLHVDVASLYPSIMLAFDYLPPRDNLKIFRGLLKDLREFRLTAKNEMKQSVDPHQKDFFNALQSTFKILINSFYGYLGFSMGHFADFDMAEAVTSKGRHIIKFMVDWLKEKGCTLIELDTDGIYFQAPKNIASPKEEEEFVEELNKELPEGINLELDGRYPSMFSYKMKNYVLLGEDGEITIKGSGLKSRGLEYFQRQFISEYFKLLLTDQKDEIENLYKRYQNMIINHDWDVKWFKKTETLQDSLAVYKEKTAAGGRNQAAVYELALESGMDYKPGDQISYYITGNKAAVTAYKNCKPAHLWDKNNPDENTKFYASKLNALYKKLVVS